LGVPWSATAARKKEKPLRADGTRWTAFLASSVQTAPRSVRYPEILETAISEIEHADNSEIRRKAGRPVALA
jgi:hypothetical protein